MEEPKELRKTSRLHLVIEMSHGSEQSELLCDISLCGRNAVWKVELFDKIEYYCQRHKPGVPDTLMTRLEPQ